MDWLSHPHAVGRFLVTAFFAVVFLQSAFDKLVDREGNLGYFGDHFKNSPVAGLVPMLFWILTIIEATAGGLCALGVLRGDFTREGMGVAAAGVIAAGVALLCLLVGQRLAKDYAGAAVVAAYFAVALLGIALF
jgi:putative oxidoreductase